MFNPTKRIGLHRAAYNILTFLLVPGRYLLLFAIHGAAKVFCMLFMYIYVCIYYRAIFIHFVNVVYIQKAFGECISATG